MQQRRGRKGFIDPQPQVAIDEQLLAQQGGEIGQAPAEAGPPLQVFEQEQSDQGRPNLNLQGVGAGADKGFDAQVLLERLEEQLDLPALVVDLGDGRGGEAAVVGEEHQGAVASSH